ncbi:hypothetical protein [Laspinema olomoucense]|uniref:hypothetical protein n=1 Tax=Laspinema olomoucense TaxID=3231600 RepID=UPI0021BA3BFD|nr:hypothetical protein [Laspinema sp. D3d]MCT7971106.1 hypothetical protein [Laspinema sp. D3d]
MLEKFGETYLNPSHIRQITFEERAGGESLVCIVNWSDGTGDRFRGETAKALHSFFVPEEDNPVNVRKIVLTLLLNPEEQKWFVGATDGKKAIRSHGLVETDDVIFHAVQTLKPFVDQDKES